MPHVLTIGLGRCFAGSALRRLAAWLAVVGVVAQLLVPLSQPQAAWVEQGLFPPTCSAHGDQAPAAVPDGAECRQCPLCQLPDGARLLVQPVRQVSPAFPGRVQASSWPEAPGPFAPQTGAHPPLPSRGPPSIT
ncbi:MAG TPA: hypothetical protein VK196_21385 [Magnetospirillum sp.]|nr:hypothetical protein [Magnetospirillum sp.]